MMNNMSGLPYMGSKRSIAKPLVDFMLYQNQNIQHVYDLFGGGGAISFEFQRRGIQTHYNELNTGICELLKKIRDEGITEEFYQRIDRDTFNKHKEDPTRFGGRLATCWSFGNNARKGYLYGKAIEELKKQAHEYIMDKGYDQKTMLTFLREFGKTKEWTTDYRRKSGRHLQHLQQLQRLQHLERLQQLKQLEQLQHLERLENLQQLETFPTITNLSYDQVEITTPPEETIIYLDPPYFGTAEYKEKLDHDALYERTHKQKCKVYVSSYNYNLPLVYSIEKRSMLARAKQGLQKKSENLYLFDPSCSQNNDF